MFTFEIASKTFQFNIKHGYAESPFGKVFVGFEKGAIYHLHFVDDENPVHVQDLQKRFPAAVLQEAAPKEAAEVIKNVFLCADDTNTFRVVLQGTEFQTQVWQQLCMIPRGCTWTYEHLAEVMGKPKAVRAVANAVASNDIAFVIPCHRVVSKNKKAKYRWGPARKAKILEHEGVKLE